MDEERRGSIRHRTLKGGRVVTNVGHSTLNCTVRNLSDTGALLRVTSIVGVPDEFELVMDDGRAFNCVLVHKWATELGVRFI